MKALVVYESLFGNTERIAQAVAAGLSDACDVTLADVTTMPPADGMDLLVVGAPTQAFGLSRPRTREDAAKLGRVRPASVDVGLREYLDVSPMLTGLAAAAFDTRLVKPPLPGSAAHKARRQLRRLGCRVVVAPETFRVADTSGPLLPGETERARRWATAIAAVLLTERHPV